MMDLRNRIIAGRYTPVPPGRYSSELTSICHGLLSTDPNKRCAPGCWHALATATTPVNAVVERNYMHSQSPRSLVAATPIGATTCMNGSLTLMEQGVWTRPRARPYTGLLCPASSPAQRQLSGCTSFRSRPLLSANRAGPGTVSSCVWAVPHCHECT